MLELFLIVELALLSFICLIFCSLTTTIQWAPTLWTSKFAHYLEKVQIIDKAIETEMKEVRSLEPILHHPVSQLLASNCICTTYPRF